MRWLIVLLGVAGVASTAFGAPVFMNENWDSYTAGSAPPAPWTQFGSQTYEVTNSTSGSAGPFSVPNGLKIQKGYRDYGITRDLATELQAALPGGTEVIATDTDELLVRFIVDFNGVDGSNEDVIIELGKGGAHVDNTGGTPKDVIAFGWTYGYFGSAGMRVFDGTDWHLTSVTSGKRSNRPELHITSTGLELIGGGKTLGTWSGTRTYLGGFDHISIRTIDNEDQTHVLDDVLVSGGVVVPEPATLCMLGLGLPILMRRRRG